jgi:hypothetical protein
MRAVRLLFGKNLKSVSVKSYHRSNYLNGVLSDDNFFSLIFMQDSGHLKCKFTGFFLFGYTTVRDECPFQKCDTPFPFDEDD